MSHVGKAKPPAGRRDPPRLRFVRRLDKIVELLVRLSTIMPHRDQYQAVKVFYFADRNHFNRYGRPITFERYVALDYGPVASSVLDLIKDDKYTLEQAGVTRLPIRISRQANIYKLDAPEREMDGAIFSKSDIAVFDEAVKDYGDKSFDELFQLTHAHTAYKSAWNDRGNGRSAPIYYEDMLEGPEAALIVDELEPVAQFIR